VAVDALVGVRLLVPFGADAEAAVGYAAKSGARKCNASRSVGGIASPAIDAGWFKVSLSFPFGDMNRSSRPTGAERICHARPRATAPNLSLPSRIDPWT